jgi:hypothetical protein
MDFSTGAGRLRGAGGGVAGADFGAVSCTVPIARGPGGAAMSCTLYTGGPGGGGDGR